MRGNRRKNRSRRSFDGDDLELQGGEVGHDVGGACANAAGGTGGLISHRLTQIPGSSDYFLLAAVTYANDAKTRLLGVAEATLAGCGAVHEDTARQMAAGVRRLAGATYGLATSGIAGPAGGSIEKPVGTVCIGLSTPGREFGYRFHYAYGRRSMNKQMFAMKAMDVLRRELMGLPHVPQIDR